MAESIPYEQILQEILAKRQLKPWEVPMSSQAPAMSAEAMPPDQMGSVADDPMAQASQRAKLMQALAPMGEVANPETQMAQQGRAPNAGLLNLLMALMR